MLDTIDQFSQAHQYTITAIGAFSTLLAVVVSLGLAQIAQRSSRTRISARVEVMFIVHSTLEGKPPEYVTVTIKNIGNMPATIPLSFFLWKLPFRRGYWMVNPWDFSAQDSWVSQKIYPVEIRPRRSETFYLSDLAGFRTTIAEMVNQVQHSRWRFRFIKAIIRTDDGKLFKVKLDKQVWLEFAKARRMGAALDHL